MRTFWIIRVHKKLRVFGAFYYVPLAECKIGPFWSYEEADKLLKKWIKEKSAGGGPI